jgi:hypothetical protein
MCFCEVVAKLNNDEWVNKENTAADLNLFFFKQ